MFLVQSGNYRNSYSLSSGHSFIWFIIAQTTKNFKGSQLKTFQFLYKSGRWEKYANYWMNLGQRGGVLGKILSGKTSYFCHTTVVLLWRTSPTLVARRLTILSWGTATTLCPLISMILCPTLTPPLSAIPPLNKLQIWNNEKHVTSGTWTLVTLTTPFWTLKPSWYLVSGLLILTSTTGGHDTAVSLTAVLFLQFCN